MIVNGTGCWVECSTSYFPLLFPLGKCPLPDLPLKVCVDDTSGAGLTFAVTLDLRLFGAGPLGDLKECFLFPWCDSIAGSTWRRD